MAIRYDLRVLKNASVVLVLSGGVERDEQDDMQGDIDALLDKWTGLRIFQDVTEFKYGLLFSLPFILKFLHAHFSPSSPHYCYPVHF